MSNYDNSLSGMCHNNTRRTFSLIGDFVLYSKFVIMHKAKGSLYIKASIEFFY